MKAKNIYEMYVLNEYKFNFYVQRDTWSNTIAKITSIDEVKEGLPIPGNPPYFLNQKVYADYFSCTNQELCSEHTKKNSGILPNPGSYAYFNLNDL